MDTRYKRSHLFFKSLFSESKYWNFQIPKCINSPESYMAFIISTKDMFQLDNWLSKFFYKEILDNDSRIKAFIVIVCEHLDKYHKIQVFESYASCIVDM